MPLRILFTQMVAGGGSMVSLRELAVALKERGHQPGVLIYKDGPHGDALRDEGLFVHSVVGPAEPDYRDATRTPSRRGPGTRNGSGSAGGAGTIPGRVGVPRRTAKDLYRLGRVDWPMAGRIADVMRRAAPDLVHQNNSIRGSRAPFLGAYRARLPQVCHVRWLHTYGVVDRGLARLGDHYIFISHAVRESCASLGLSPDRGSVIYNPVSQPHRRSTAEDDALRRELKVGPEDLLVVNPGRLVAWKGQDVFLESMALVRECFPNAVALVVGEETAGAGSDGFGEELERKARALGIADGVRFTGFRSDVRHVMALADVVVHSAVAPEPFGRVIAEAMTAGRPVVATRGGGVPEIVEDGSTGLLVPMGEARPMAEAITRLLGDRTSAAAMGAAARASALRRFDVETHVTRIEEVYRTVLGAARPNLVEVSGG